jgi:hypothetical protein
LPDDKKETGMPEDAMSFPASRRFAPHEMVGCEACGRVNPPTRGECFYCGARLPFGEAGAKLRRPALAHVEEWEKGFNVVLLAPPVPGGLTNDALVEISSLLRIGSEDLQRLFKFGVPLPLARTATLDDASLIMERLSGLGMSLMVIADEELRLQGPPPMRIRALKMQKDGLVALAIGSAGAFHVTRDELLLLVSGRILTHRVEAVERKGRGPDEIVDARETSSDEELLDVYTAGDDRGWRIASGSFDFSCLGESKTLMAGQNLSLMIRRLQEEAPQVRYDNSFKSIHHALAFAWPARQQTEARGWRRAPLSRYGTEVVTTSDNEAQFTRYSRLCHYLAFRPNNQ